MRRRALALPFLLAFALAGCGGTGPTATVAADAPFIPLPAEASVPAAEVAVAPAVAPEPPAPEEPAVVPTPKAPPATTAPLRATPPPVPVTPAPEPEIAPAVAAVPAGGCDPSYPGVCIPPGPPDLDCADVPYARFTVIGADPHRFDADGDAVGCESN